MSIPVLINGARGKMGQLAVQTINEHADFQLVATTQRHNDLAAEIKKSGAQVVIDFTHAESVFKNTNTIIDAGAHPVIGTSGLLPDQVELLQQRCAKLKLGGIIAPNFSLGAALMMKCAQEIARYFSQVEVIEMHHAGKLDSPSGTAIYTADLISKARGQVADGKKNHETIPGARGAIYQEVPIHSVRLPGLMAHQQIIFGGEGETLTVRCDTIDRKCYASGIVLACRKVMALDRLVSGLERVI